MARCYPLVHLDEEYEANFLVQGKKTETRTWTINLQIKNTKPCANPLSQHIHSNIAVETASSKNYNAVFCFSGSTSQGVRFGIFRIATMNFWHHLFLPLDSYVSWAICEWRIEKLSLILDRMKFSLSNSKFKGIGESVYRPLSILSPMGLVLFGDVLSNTNSRWVENRSKRLFIRISSQWSGTTVGVNRSNVVRNTWISLSRQ